jgi:hypothetical protein
VFQERDVRLSPRSAVARAFCSRHIPQAPTSGQFQTLLSTVLCLSNAVLINASSASPALRNCLG